MADIVCIHAFRRGAGSSQIAANLAVLLGASGYRVGVVDANFQAPWVHFLLGLPDTSISHTLNDYLWDHCSITDAIYEVTGSSGLNGRAKGQIFLVPSSSRLSAITRLLRQGYDGAKLNEGLELLLTRLNLDVLLVDTQPGLTEDSLFTLSLADTLLAVLQLDQQDYRGTAVTLELARRLGVPRILLLVNKVSGEYELQAVRDKVGQTYGCEVIAALPHSDDLLRLGSESTFVLRYPYDVLTTQLKQVALVLALEGGKVAE